MAKNWLLIISILFFGCFQNQSTQDLIPVETFKQILIDIEKHKHVDSHETENDTSAILDNTLIKYGVSDTIYQKTLLFYAKKPQEMFSILKEVEAYVY